MIRLNLVKGLGPMLQICEGYTLNLPEEVSDKLWNRTDYTWPCTWFAPRTEIFAHRIGVIPSCKGKIHALVYALADAAEPCGKTVFNKIQSVKFAECMAHHRHHEIW